MAAILPNSKDVSDPLRQDQRVKKSSTLKDSEHISEVKMQTEMALCLNYVYIA